MSYYDDLAVCSRMLNNRIINGVPTYKAYNIYSECVSNAHLPSNYASDIAVCNRMFYNRLDSSVPYNIAYAKLADCIDGASLPQTHAPVYGTCYDHDGEYIC